MFPGVMDSSDRGVETRKEAVFISEERSFCSSSGLQMNKDTAEKRAVRKGNISNKSLNLKSSFKKSGFPRTQVDTEMFPPYRLFFFRFCESMFPLFCLSKSAFCLSYVLLSYCYVLSEAKEQGEESYLQAWGVCVAGYIPEETFFATCVMKAVERYGGSTNTEESRRSNQSTQGHLFGSGTEPGVKTRHLLLEMVDLKLLKKMSSAPTEQLDF